MIESGGDVGVAATIKSHHNVGGLPDDMDFELVEPLRLLFKDEVRGSARSSACPSEWSGAIRSPGPGLAIRIIGEVTEERLDDPARAPTRSCSRRSGRPGSTGSCGSASPCCPAVRSVGVMGDERTYAYPIVIRAVTSEDAMTADWARLPYDLLEPISSRDHQRGARRQPRRARHLLEAAGDDRVGIGQLREAPNGSRPGIPGLSPFRSPADVAYPSSAPLSLLALFAQEAWP